MAAGRIAGRDAAGIFKPDVTVALFVFDQLPTHHQQRILVVALRAPVIPVARPDHTVETPVFRTNTLEMARTFTHAVRRVRKRIEDEHAVPCSITLSLPHSQEDLSSLVGSSP